MKKDVFKILAEIIIISFAVLWSIPIWDTFASQLPTFNIDNRCLESLEMTLLEGGNEDVILTSKEEINELSATKVVIKNHSGETSCGRLFLTYSKSSIIDYKFIKIKVADELIDLQRFLMTSNDSNYIFIIDNLDISPYESREYELYIRLNDEELANFNTQYYDYNINLSISN